ncbi:MAG: hypothetical protein DMG31_03760 [Acidobacteria bacterium]|nr:MAG: hypothetical protein DMG31_03760 [Acidobacteriota bacterium]
MISIRCQSFSSIYYNNDNAVVAASRQKAWTKVHPGVPKSRMAALAVILWSVLIRIEARKQSGESTLRKPGELLISK